MTEDERLHHVIYLLRERSARPALQSPSEAEIPKIARKIIEAATGPKSLWTKWGPERDEIATRAADLWVHHLHRELRCRGTIAHGRRQPAFQTYIAGKMVACFG